jgi:hypothetical protein
LPSGFIVIIVIIIIIIIIIVNVIIIIIILPNLGALVQAVVLLALGVQHVVEHLPVDHVPKPLRRRHIHNLRGGNGPIIIIIIIVIVVVVVVIIIMKVLGLSYDHMSIVEHLPIDHVPKPLRRRHVHHLIIIIIIIIIIMVIIIMVIIVTYRSFGSSPS